VNALRKFLALPAGKQLLLIEAWMYLGAARAALLSLPFRRISRHLGRQLNSQDEAISNGPTSVAAREIGWAVELMSRHTSWESACLAQSIAGKFMLRRRGLASRISLGLRKDEAGKLTAHAWLRAGNEILIGGSGHEEFTVLSTFGEPDG
jgi:hypothetical protein